MRNLCALLLCLSARPSFESAGIQRQFSVNAVFNLKLGALLQALPTTTTLNTSIPVALAASLHFLHTAILPEHRRLMMLIPELERSDVRALLTSLASIAFSTASQCRQSHPAAKRVLNCIPWTPHSFTSDSSATSLTTYMQALSLQLSQLDTHRSYGTVRLAYPLLRRAIMALLLNIFAAGHMFTQSESEVIASMCSRLHKLHRLGAQSKAIIEFVHISKSGGTSLCQLAKLNGCQTETFSQRQNCLISEFSDYPRWTRPAAFPGLSIPVTDLPHHKIESQPLSRTTDKLDKLAPVKTSAASSQKVGIPASEQKKEPWCARSSSPSPKWTCRARRAYMHKLRYNFYANEFLVLDHSGHGGSNKDLAGLLGSGRSRFSDQVNSGGLDSVSAGSGSLSSQAREGKKLKHSGNKTASTFDYVREHGASGHEASLKHENLNPMTASMKQGNYNSNNKTADANSTFLSIGNSFQDAFTRSRRGDSESSRDSGSNRSSGSSSTEKKSKYHGISKETGAFDWRTARPCSEFLSVTLFRSVVPRLASHLANIHKEYTSFYGEEHFCHHFDDQNLENWLRLAPSVIDNYMVRSLLGRSVYFLPAGGLHADHGTAAKLVALQFEVVLTLGDAELSEDIFRLGLGWHHGLAHLHTRQTEVLEANELYQVASQVRGKSPMPTNAQPATSAVPDPQASPSASLPNSIIDAFILLNATRQSTSIPVANSRMYISSPFDQGLSQQQGARFLNRSLLPPLSSLMQYTKLDADIYVTALVAQTLDAICFAVVLQVLKEKSIWMDTQHARLHKCGYINAFRKPAVNATRFG